MTSSPVLLHPPWPDRERQRVAYAFGLWLFLASEVLFFGALLFAYAAVRGLHPRAVAEAASHADVAFGTVNTAILMTSSLTAAIAERAVAAGRTGLARLGHGATLALGLGFLVVKGFEYAKDLGDHLLPGAGFGLGATPAVLFWGFYWIATGVHAVHVTVGLGLIGRLVAFGARRTLGAHRNSVETTTLYWHLVDVVWVVLYPLIYLVGRP